MKKWIIAVVAILAVSLLGYGLINHLSAKPSPLAPAMSEMAPTGHVAPQPLDEEMLARMIPGDIAEMLNDLYRQWLREFEGEGWLCVIASHDRSDDEYGVLSDGTLIPADDDMHSWWFINGDGMIEDVISLMFDTQGTLIQSSYSNWVIYYKPAKQRTLGDRAARIPAPFMGPGYDHSFGTGSGDRSVCRIGDGWWDGCDPGDDPCNWSSEYWADRRCWIGNW